MGDVIKLTTYQTSQGFTKSKLVIASMPSSRKSAESLLRHPLFDARIWIEGRQRYGTKGFWSCSSEGRTTSHPEAFGC